MREFYKKPGGMGVKEAQKEAAALRYPTLSVYSLEFSSNKNRVWFCFEQQWFKTHSGQNSTILLVSLTTDNRTSGFNGDHCIIHEHIQCVKCVIYNLKDTHRRHVSKKTAYDKFCA